MRQIGFLHGEPRARAFSDFLVANGVSNEIEHESDGTWSVWVRNEDQISTARNSLARFRDDPDAPEFREAATEAARVRRAEAEDLAAYRQRIRTRRSLFPKFGGYGVGVLTYALIVVCLVVAFYTGLGENDDVLRHLFISDPGSAEPGRFLPEVFAGELWRLFTPMFLHFGVIHLIFNLMWLYQLGCMIEARLSSGYLAALVAVTELGSSLAQYHFSGSPAFGGMSGVVYGLAGFAWIRGKFDRASGVYLDPQSVTILLVWLVICYTGLIGRIANTAHLVGLVVGVVWGRFSAYRASRKPD